MRILVVDDEKNIRRSMEIILSGEGYDVRSVGNAGSALSEIKENLPHLIFLDVLLPDQDGLTLLTKIKALFPEIEIVMISGHANLSMAVQATRAGAYDFLEKPLQKEKILILIRHLLEKDNLKNQFRKLQQEKFDEYQMIGDCNAIQILKEQISRVAPTSSKVLILGESGTGKELVAWEIHRQSNRKDGPFVKMNCAAIPGELTESELFGSEKGAFTGATEKRDGKFLQADGGTLFLDEIADMSLSVQTKVLRVLQDGQFERVGGKNIIKVDVRIIAATNKNLNKMVQENKFREDLYYRLNVFPITTPPLNERKEDIPKLLEYFINKFCFENNFKIVRIEKNALENLKKYTWPGNIRELKNMVERLVISSKDQIIRTSDLPPHLFQSQATTSKVKPGDLSLKEVKENAERGYILSCLQLSDGNVSKAAKMLKLERTNLHKKMKYLGISKEKSLTDLNE